MNFSILMSIYFKEDPTFFNQAMESIWAQQTLKPNAIILVEDGPLTEELYDAVKLWEIKIPNILQIVSLPQNVGLAKALNEGITHCSNEWIFRMDTDDICLPDRFEKQIQFIKQNHDIDILGTQVLEFEINPETENLIHKSVPLTNNEILKYAKKRCPFNHMSVAYKKSVIQKIGGYQHHLLMEDYNLWIRVLSAGHKAANLPESLLYVRTGSSMIKRRRGIQYINSEWQLFKLKLNLNFQNPIFAFGYFIIRSVPRFLPSFLLAPIYKIIRKT